ncbi:MAG: lysine--tRNA ligase [Pseudomonadota bacterium]
MSTPSDDENFLIAERRRKLAELREAGNAYPNDFRRDALSAELHAAAEGLDDDALEAKAIRAKVAGRMMAKRVMGKASFAQLQDDAGRIQLYMQRDGLPEGVYQQFKTWDVGDLIGVEGTLFRTRTGELSVKAEQARLLTKSLRPLPDKYHGLADQEMRYRRRYVDLIVNEESRRVFRTRAAIVRAMRDFLSAKDFMEVETPMMQVIPGGAIARPFITHHNALDMDLYLRIAPELYLKRLTVGGFERVFEVNRNFRNEGLSPRHNPEFTMLELYEAYADCDDIMDLTEGMIRDAAKVALGTLQFSYQEREYDLGQPFRRVSVIDAVLADDPTLDAARLRDRDYLAERCAQAQIETKPEFGAGRLLMELFEARVEHTLLDPTFITGYPTEVSPLARCNDDDPFLTDRFELFIAGREIANGFSELNDPDDQAQRFRDQVAAKDAGDDEAMYFDADYVRALEYGLPPSGGLGVGIDRLVMFFTDSPSIRDVLLFPHMRPEAPAAGTATDHEDA